MDTLRKPFLILAIALIAVVVLIELGDTSLLGRWPTRLAAALAGQPSNPVQDVAQALEAQAPPEVRDALKNLDSEQREQLKTLGNQDRPPGLGIPSLALVDGIALFTAALIGLSVVIPARIQGRVQGVATLIFSILILIAAILAALAAFVLVTTMVALLLAIPFGTIVYLVIYGSFDAASARAVLSLLMVLKLGFVVSLLLAHQRFAANTGLVLIVVTSLLANIIVSFLHSLVPGILVSITDAISAIVVAVLAILWAFFLLIGSIISVIKAIRLKV